MMSRTGALAILLALAALLALSPGAASAKLYKYRDASGEWAYTNDPDTIPEGQRAQMEEFQLEKELPSDLPTQQKQAAAAATAAENEAADESSPTFFARAVAMGADIVSTAILPLDAAENVVIEKDTGLIALPETLAEAEQRARPYLRMLLLFLIVVAAGTLAGVYIRRMKRGGIEGIAGLPIFQIKGFLFGASVFVGGFLAWFIWHGAQLNWRAEIAELWDATGGAVAARTGEEGARMEVELTDGTTAEIKGPGQLIAEHNSLVALLLAALDKAEDDVEFLEATCTNEEGSDSPGETIQRLMKMKQILDEAKRKEKDLKRFRSAAARRGFSLGPDPIAKNQPKFKKLQERLAKAQSDCMALSMKGHKMKQRALDSMR